MATILFIPSQGFKQVLLKIEEIQDLYEKAGCKLELATEHGGELYLDETMDVRLRLTLIVGHIRNLTGIPVVQVNTPA
jgi:hypothetical protein